VESKENPLHNIKQQSSHLPEDDYEYLVEYLTNRGILDKDARKITHRVVENCKNILPGKILRGYAEAEVIYQKRLRYDKPIM
jgi:hypothetical protein